MAKPASPSRGAPHKTKVTQLVEVLDRHGHVVRRYTVELDHADCFDADFEEVALILAEKDGAVAEHLHVRARCMR